jgi:hypothetical protein
VTIATRLGSAYRAFAGVETPPEGDIAGHGSGSIASSYIGDLEANIGTYRPSGISFTVMRKMMLDPTIKACSALSELALRFAPWDVDGPDALHAEFIRAAIEPVWGSIIKGCARTGVYEGCAPFETVYQRTDTSVKTADDAGAVVENTVTGWTLSKVKDIDPASLVSIYVNGLEDFNGLGLTYPYLHLEAERCFHFSSGMRFGNYWGEGRLLSVYDAWYAHRILHSLFMRFMARRTTPAVHVEFPPGENSDGVANANTARAIAAGFQSDATSMWTQSSMDGEASWAVSLVEDAQRAQTAGAFLAGAKALEMRMMLGLLTPEKVLNGDGGSNALSDTHKDVWLLGVQGTFSEIIDAVNAQIVPRLIRYTFGDVAIPRIVTPGMSDEDKLYLGSLFTELVKAGSVDVDGDSIAERIGVPTRTGESAQTEGTPDSTMAENRDAAMRLADELQAARLSLAVR